MQKKIIYIFVPIFYAVGLDRKGKKEMKESVKMPKKKEIKKEDKKKEGKGFRPEDFFVKMKIDEKEIFNTILTAITGAVISKIDSVEIETKNQIVRMRINFK